MAPRFELELFLYDTRKALRPSEKRVGFDHCANQIKVDEVCTSVAFDEYSF